MQQKEQGELDKFKDWDILVGFGTNNSSFGEGAIGR